MPGEGGSPALWIKEGPTPVFFQYKQDLLGGFVLFCFQSEEGSRRFIMKY